MYFLITALYSEIIHLYWIYTGKYQWDNSRRLRIKGVSTPSRRPQLCFCLQSQKWIQAVHLASRFRSTSWNYSSSFESYRLLVLWLINVFPSSSGSWNKLLKTNKQTNKKAFGKEVRAEPWKGCPGTLPPGLPVLSREVAPWVAILGGGQVTHTHGPRRFP